MGDYSKLPITQMPLMRLKRILCLFPFLTPKPHFPETVNYLNNGLTQQTQQWTRWNGFLCL